MSLDNGMSATTDFNWGQIAKREKGEGVPETKVPPLT